MDPGLYRLQGEAEVVVSLHLTAVALGSNQGDRYAHLAYAVSRLRTLLSNLRVSPLMETEPEDVESQPRFLNGVAVGECAAEPATLMAGLLAIEQARGRTRPHRGAPRTLDLDLIVMGDVVVVDDRLQVPHPRFRRRRFVLEPLVAVAPDLVDPISGRTMRELLAALSGDARHSDFV